MTLALERHFLQCDPAPKNNYYFFFIRGPTYLAIAIYISAPSFPAPFLLFFHFTFSPFRHFLPTRGPSWKCYDSHSFLCCIAFAWGHWESAETLCWHRPFKRICPQSTVSEKITFRVAFRRAGRRPVVTQPSIDPALSCFTRVTV